MVFSPSGKGRFTWESSGRIPRMPIPAGAWSRAWEKHGASQAVAPHKPWVAEGIPRQPGCVMPQQLENH